MPYLNTSSSVCFAFVKIRTCDYSHTCIHNVVFDTSSNARYCCVSILMYRTIITSRVYYTDVKKVFTSFHYVLFNHLKVEQQRVYKLSQICFVQ